MARRDHPPGGISRAVAGGGSIHEKRQEGEGGAGHRIPAVWNDYSVFQRAGIADQGRALEWPGEIDFCADALWLKVTRNQTMNKKLAAIIEHDDHGYYAYCPELKGCQTQGDTFEEALANLREAVELYLETLSEEEKTTVFSRSVITTTLDMAHA